MGGAELPALIAYQSLGALSRMVVYAIGCPGIWLISVALGWWKLALIGGIAVADPLYLMTFTWLAWILAGGVFGLSASTYDDNHLPV